MICSGKGTDLFVPIFVKVVFVLALNQGHQFAGTVGFKQEPKEMSFYGLLAISEIVKFYGQFIRKKHLAGYDTQLYNCSAWLATEAS